jgi:hypothetical protein
MSYEERAAYWVKRIEDNQYTNFNTPNFYASVAHVYATLALVEQSKKMNEITEVLFNNDQKQKELEDKELELRGLIRSYRRMIKDLSEGKLEKEK